MRYVVEPPKIELKGVKKMKISCVFNLVNGKKTSRSGKCTSPQVKGRTNMYAESMFGMRLI